MTPTWPNVGDTIVVNRHDGKSGLYMVDYLHWSYKDLEAEPKVVGFHYRALRWYERLWVRVKEVALRRTDWTGPS